MRNYRIIILCLITFAFISFVSAGIGIRSYQESALVNEGEEACLIYGAYNPFSTGTQVIIGVSEGLNEVLVMQEIESKFVPPGTSSQDAIPLKFCFKVPEVYHRDYTIVGKFIDKLDCTEEQKIYEGEVEISSAPSPNAISGTGGSATVMSVSSPLRIKVQCNPYPWNYTPAYIILAVLSASIVGWVLLKRYRKPKSERDKEKLKKLRAQIAKETRKKKK